MNNQYNRNGYYGWQDNSVNPEAASHAKSAKYVGLAAIISTFLSFGTASIVCAIFALSFASKSKKLNGDEYLPDAKLGKTLGTVSLIVSIILIALMIIFFIFYFTFVIAIITQSLQY